MSLQSRMANELFLSTQYVSLLTRTASKRYKSYNIPKRRGGFRTIFHPSRELKALQRWLVFNVIAEWPVHPAASAYRQHRSIKDNAGIHRHNAFLLKLDFDSFFPSITADDIHRYLELGPAAELQWTGRDISTFLNIVCRNDQLIIGAPTSPSLSNALCFELDRRVAAWAAERGIAYSRYADDIALSCNQPDVLRTALAFVEDTLQLLPTPRRLRMNHAKTRHLSRKHRRVVTGIVLTPAGDLSLGRHRKRMLRSLIHSYQALSVEEKRSLAGLLSYAISIEPDLVNRLVIKFGAELVKKARTPPTKE
jgi:RNA-directed DNA polymerase